MDGLELHHSYILTWLLNDTVSTAWSFEIDEEEFVEKFNRTET